MVESNGALIEKVIADSIAAEMGIESGDRLVGINGTPVKDLLDYRYLIADENIEVEVLKGNGEEWVIDIEKDYDEDLGLVFAESAFGGIRQCANRCIFCFVDQMPPGMRKSLYVKDDDYRHSFFNGNFITLTNLSDADVQRITSMHLSPLYISVHTTTPELRVKMQGQKRAGQVMELLKKFAAADIEMHTQVVLCPEINDGEILEKTIGDLFGLWPQVRSLAIVPVGLTKFREGLFDLRKFTISEASEVVDIIENYQNQSFAKRGEYFVYASDEFYLLSGRNIPDAKRYDDFPQTENGVGLTRLFLDSFDKEEKNLPSEVKEPRTVTLATGFLGGQVLTNVVDRLNEIKNLKVNLKVIRNNFFGETVTVSGLVTGQDILSQLTGIDLGQELLIPSVMQKRDENIFLDGMTLKELAEGFKVKINIVNTEIGAADLIDKVIGGA